MIWESAPLSPTVLQTSNLLSYAYNPALRLGGTAEAGGLLQEAELGGPFPTSDRCSLPWARSTQQSGSGELQLLHRGDGSL